ncbi:hypothetical protein LCGC14_3115790 [marine sediment metagenome]|uniref:DUF2179 domain-containing protein n=1 Tax=marine sediment metagenome TaxID=412755 RepID=A0A0F8W467_9ZZZZ
MLYRIITENKNYDHIVEIVKVYFTGFTIIKAQGYWKNTAEHSLIIEIVTDKANRNQIDHIAYNIKKRNEQQAVLVQSIPVESKLI